MYQTRTPEEIQADGRRDLYMYNIAEQRLKKYSEQIRKEEQEARAYMRELHRSLKQ